MSRDIHLTDFIEKLSRELIAQSPSVLELSNAELTVSFNAQQDAHGDIQFLVRQSEEDVSTHTLKFKLNLSSVAKDAEVLKSGALAIVEEADHTSDFEGFKRRFKESVKRHGGVPPNKKKSVFD